jgi:pilus assembly protein CpaF
MLSSVETAEQIVEREVRELVRRRGLDPREEGGARAVSRIIDEVIADYQDRSLTAAMPALADPGGVARAVHARIVGAGPLQPYFDDPEVEEIWVNEPGKVFVARAGQTELTTTIMTDQEVRDLVEVMLRSSGRRVDLSSPFVDATLADGSRLHVVIPDITRRHWAVNIRKLCPTIVLTSRGMRSAAWMRMPSTPTAYRSACSHGCRSPRRRRS